jgi:diacylglycerol kinase family enzyme
MIPFATHMPATSVGSQVFVGFNPHAGAKDPGKLSRVEELCSALRKRGLAAEIVSDRDTLATLANDTYRRGGLRAVVAAGGDGTAADLANRCQPGIPMALLPLGTENLLARYLRLPSEPRDVAALVAAGQSVALDAGTANGRLFLLMAGCGFDGEVVRRLHAQRDGHITQWTYVKPILAAIRRYQYPQFELRCTLSVGGQEAPIEQSFVARWAFISNLPCYAGRLCFSPQAVGDDGRLDLCAFQGRSLWSGLRYLVAVLAHRHQSLRDCVIARATRIVLTAGEPVPYQVDGDPGGWLPLAINVLPRRIKVLIPPSNGTARMDRQPHRRAQ